MATKPKKHVVTTELSKRLAEEQISAALKCIEEFRVHLACTQDAIKTHEERVSIMQAWQTGKTIQQANYIPNPEWTDTRNPTWNWVDYDYRIKPQPWRAEKGLAYFYIDIYCNIKETIDMRYPSEQLFWELGNYFKTREEAEAVAEKFREIFSTTRETSCH